MRDRLETIDDPFTPAPGISVARCSPIPLSSRPKRSAVERSTPGQTDPNPFIGSLIPHFSTRCCKPTVFVGIRYKISPLRPGSAGPPVEMTVAGPARPAGQVRQTNPISAFVAQKRRLLEENKPNQSQFCTRSGGEPGRNDTQSTPVVMLSETKYLGAGRKRDLFPRAGQILHCVQDDRGQAAAFRAGAVRQTNPISAFLAQKPRLPEENRPNQSQFRARVDTMRATL